MTFKSILFTGAENAPAAALPDEPAFFVDLNLNQIIDAITANKEEYNLKPFYYASLQDMDTVAYRHEIMQDLENKVLFEHIKVFSEKMRHMKRHRALVDKLEYKYHREGWFLEAVAIYCEAVHGLVRGLTSVDLKSRGFLAFREYLSAYTGSAGFASLAAETEKLKMDLSSVTYCLLIKDNCITVSPLRSNIDYSAEVERTFERFKEGAGKNYKVEIPARTGMNHIEAQVLDLVAQLYPDVFSNLDRYFAKNGNYLDETIAVFEREIQFYMAYAEHIESFKPWGLQFCYPQLSPIDKESSAYDSFDLALAYKLGKEHAPVVCNDFYLKGKERLLVVSGPNQGGKTTFARMFGQVHYLASLGLPVPGREAKLLFFDRLFTHFEKEENIRDLRGKLEDDLIRIHQILNQATGNSIIIMNEILTSTTLHDALMLSGRILEKIMGLDCLCVWVTFLDELSRFSEKTVSMVSTVDPDNRSRRTYKILRMPADGLAYAASIAKKYRLTYDCIKERIPA